MNSNIILYTTDNGNVSVQVQYEDGTFWFTQKRMAELFGVEVPTVNYHLKEIFHTGEIQEDRTIRKIRIVQKEGKRKVERELDFYHLDAIIAVGYRVNSREATQFRIWATRTLNEFITKGYVLDKERLKQGEQFGKDYFEDLLEQIREICASERRFYQKITDIYSLATDYDKNALITNHKRVSGIESGTADDQPGVDKNGNIKTFKSIQEFLDSDYNTDNKDGKGAAYYTKAYMLPTTTEQDKTIIDGMKEKMNEDYHFFGNNCSEAVVYALGKAGVKLDRP